MNYQVGDKVTVIDFCPLDPNEQGNYVKAKQNWLSAHKNKVYTVKRIVASVYYSIEDGDGNGFNPKEIRLLNRYLNGSLNSGGNI